MYEILANSPFLRTERGMALKRACNCFFVFLEGVSILLKVGAVFVCVAGVYFGESGSYNRVICITGLCVFCVSYVVWVIGVCVVLVVLGACCGIGRGIWRPGSMAQKKKVGGNHTSIALGSGLQML